MDPLAKALATTACVAALLALARRCGQRLAGLLTGLPLVTAPALLWMALDRGAAFAAVAAAGCVAAGAVCALFGLGYAWASRRSAPAAALAAGALLAGLPLPLLAHRPLALEASALVSLAACAICAAGLRPCASALRVPYRRTAAPRAFDAALTAGLAGVVSGLAAMWAGDLGAFWSGLVASAPLLAAFVAMRLHRDQGSGAVTPYLHGYLGGLIGRTCFAAVFAIAVTGW